MTNKELKELFKKKLDTRDTEFSEESWLRMEQMLDARLPVTPWHQTSLRWVKGLTAATVAGLSVWFMTINVDQPVAQESELENDVLIQEMNIDEQLTNSSTINLSDDLNNFTDGESKPPEDLAAGTNAAVAANTSTPLTTLIAETRLSNVSREETTYFEEQKMETLNRKLAKILEEEQEILAEEDMQKSKAAIKINRKYSEWRVGVSFQAITAKNTAKSMEGYSNAPTTPGWALGFTTARKLGKRTSLQAGLNYSWKKTDGTYYFTEKDYDFGSDKISTTVTEMSQQMIEIPLTFQYHMGVRHQLKAGLYGSYLFATRSKVETTVDNGFTVEEQSKYVFITDASQNNLDAGFIFGYAYSFDKSLQLGVDAWSGFMDVYPENDELTKRNFMIRVALNYWL